MNCEASSNPIVLWLKTRSLHSLSKSPHSALRMSSRAGEHCLRPQPHRPDPGQADGRRPTVGMDVKVSGMRGSPGQGYGPAPRPPLRSSRCQTETMGPACLRWWMSHSDSVCTLCWELLSSDSFFSSADSEKEDMAAGRPRAGPAPPGGGRDAAAPTATRCNKMAARPLTPPRGVKGQRLRGARRAKRLRDRRAGREGAVRRMRGPPTEPAKTPRTRAAF